VSATDDDDRTGDHMIRTKVAGAALGTTLLFGALAPAVAAQEDDDAPLDNPVTEDTNADDEGGFDDWGLLGLLGLLGLGGLAGRKRQDTVTTTRRTTGTTGTGSTTR
jgi:MYXO-CTERM domain-containing protein